MDPDDEFREVLDDLLYSASREEILAVPGVWDALLEHYEPEVFDALAERREDELLRRGPP